ncbi:hypothetical protein CC78DRAFT_535759 [Lojkania enalia]|uniref:Tachykinin family protein n=1 Tax=Lojkania enalia TaxID=147567 RepID=A0A9P4N184_9PLEO|nr:hypothetical protein CC78DRAFT_535759 [Didymosphaeria enalia]
MDREYEFFVTTEKPHQPDGPERGLIRRLVMRNFFETKWAGPASDTSEHNSASTIQSKGKLKTRFRLRKPGQDFTNQKTKPKSGTSERQARKAEGESTKQRTGSSIKLSGNSDTSEPSTQRMAVGRWPLSTDGESRASGKTKPRSLLNANPNAHRFDPFDVLPVPGTPQLNMLFRLYKSGSRANSIAINARNTWWNFISQDAGLLHATLATWALYGMLVRGLSDLRFDKLRHKNAAIKEINSKISIAAGKVSDELIGTVLTLASFENLVGAYDAAQLHISALKRMVNARGGLFAFGHNDGLIRGMLWVDFHTAAAFHTPPSFPQIRLDPDTPPLPDILLEEAAFTSPTCLLQLSLSAIDCFNIFYRLHRLAIATSSHWILKVNRLTVSNLLYETEYIILSVSDYSRYFLDFDLELKDEKDEDNEEQARMADAASVVEALLASTQIFLYAALREIPPKARIFSILLNRLRLALDRPNSKMVEVWKRERNFNMLVWVLVVASSVASAWGERSWWIRRLSEVVKELGICDELELEALLQRVAWTDIFFRNNLNEVWEEVHLHLNATQEVDALLPHALSTNLQVGQGETIDPRLLGPVGPPIQQCIKFDMCRWKVDGWYA